MYRIIIKKRAKKFIDKLPKQEKLRLVTAIEELPNGSDIYKIFRRKPRGLPLG